MVENIWIRGKEFANFIGLLSGGVGTMIIGNQMPNKGVWQFGLLTSSLFVTLCLVTIGLAIRDAILDPKRFWASLPMRV